MEKYLDILSKNRLFKGINTFQLPTTLNCLNPIIRKYPKNSYIYNMGDQISTIGIVLSGTVNVAREDVYGGRHILASLTQGDLFAEAFICAGIDEIPVSVIANTECELLFVDFKKLMTTCKNNCVSHEQIIFNMMQIIAMKNVKLNEKIAYLNGKNTREKISMYLVSQLTSDTQTVVKIPFNRNDLAEYLGINRSVLSRELSKMKKDGLIDFDKNTFYIKEPLEY